MKNNDRRKFLKKVAYVAPVVAGLGALTSATKVEAGPFGSGHGSHVSRAKNKKKEM